MSLPLSNRKLIVLWIIRVVILVFVASFWISLLTHTSGSCAAVLQHMQLQLEHGDDESSICPGHDCNQNANHGRCAGSLPAGDTTQEKGPQATEILGHCGLFLNAFIGTMEKLEGSLNVPVKLWR